MARNVTRAGGLPEYGPPPTTSAGSGHGTGGAHTSDAHDPHAHKHRMSPVWQYGSMGMVSHMKTTVEISDALLDEARRTARKEGTTLRALIEEGLRSVLAEHTHRSHPFMLRDASVGGEGLQPQAQGASWEQLRGLAYGDRL